MSIDFLHLDISIKSKICCGWIWRQKTRPRPKCHLHKMFAHQKSGVSAARDKYCSDQSPCSWNFSEEEKNSFDEGDCCKDWVRWFGQCGWGEPVDEELKPSFIFLWKVLHFWQIRICFDPVSHLVDNVLTTNWWWEKADKANEAKAGYSWSDKIRRQHRIWQLTIASEYMYVLYTE